MRGLTLADDVTLLAKVKKLHEADYVSKNLFSIDFSF